MEIQVNSVSLVELNTKLLIAGMFEEDNVQDCGYTWLNDTVNDGIELAMERKDFSGKANKSLFLYGNSSSQIGRVLIIGLGKRSEFNFEKIRRCYGVAGKLTRKSLPDEVALMVPVSGFAAEDQTGIARAAIEGFGLSSHDFNKYRTQNIEDHPDLKFIYVIPAENENPSVIEAAVNEANSTIPGTCFARDLGSMPPCELYPESFADIAKTLESDRVKIEILDFDQIKELGMGALAAVGQGSINPPVLIHLKYDPGIKGDTKKLAVVGKGLTYDAGGFDLKTAEGLRHMKIDMCGSAAVMGLFKVIEHWNPQCRVDGFIAAAENLASSNAYKPGDILTSYKGLSIEVDNTDAEGRLTLADALTYAEKTIKPDLIIDLATLTGAIGVALGKHASGMFTDDDDTAKLLTESGDIVGERVWRMPVWKEYLRQIQSQVADLKNTGGRQGGACTAAVFLKQFVDKTPHVHLDIAGTAFNVPLSYVPGDETPSGVGVRLLLEFLRRWT